MSTQTQIQRPKPAPRPDPPADAPTTDPKIARTWFRWNAAQDRVPSAESVIANNGWS